LVYYLNLEETQTLNKIWYETKYVRDPDDTRYFYEKCSEEADWTEFLLFIDCHLTNLLFNDTQTVLRNYFTTGLKDDCSPSASLIDKIIHHANLSLQKPSEPPP
jgi:hypothetical protein